MPPDGIPDYIDNVEQSLENAWYSYDWQGYKPPSEPIPVLIGGMHGKIAQGNAFTLPPALGGTIIIMSNVGSEIYLPTHESFHAFQYDYIPRHEMLDDWGNLMWWMEATADYEAGVILPSYPTLYDADGDTEADQPSRRLPKYLGSTTQSLSKYDGFGGPRAYGEFILAQYLSLDSYSWPSPSYSPILETWQHIGSGDLPVSAIDAMLRDHGTNLAKELPKFAKAIYQLGPDPDCWGYPTVEATPDLSMTPEYANCGYDSEQTQFFLSDNLTTWNYWLGHNRQTQSTSRNDPAEGLARPAHAITALTDAGRPKGRHDVQLAPGGISFTDITGASSNHELQVTVTAPRNLVRPSGEEPAPVTLFSVHVSLIGWSDYANHERCQWDEDATLTAPTASVTLTTAPLRDCSFVTLIITDVMPGDGAGNDMKRFTWSSTYVDPPPVIYH